MNLGIEYDGQAWHKDIKKDIKKDVACQKNGIKLIRIREPECPKYIGYCNFIYLNDLTDISLENAIYKLMKILKVKNINININDDIVEIENLIYFNLNSKSLYNLYPNISNEWNYDKNGNLKPNDVMGKSAKIVWWKCSKCNHEWQDTIINRVIGKGCPKCKIKQRSSGKKVYCIELNKIYKSISCAQDQTGVKRSNISANLVGKTKTAGINILTGEKLHWYYVYDTKRRDGTIIEGAISKGLITENDVVELC